MYVMPAPPAYPVPGLGRWRVRRALTQDALAQAARVGRVTIARIESGSPARLGTIHKLAQALRVEPEQLMDGE